MRATPNSIHHRCGSTVVWQRIGLKLSSLCRFYNTINKKCSDCALQFSFRLHLLFHPRISACNLLMTNDGPVEPYHLAPLLDNVGNTARVKRLASSLPHSFGGCSSIPHKRHNYAYNVIQSQGLNGPLAVSLPVGTNRFLGWCH